MVNYYHWRIQRKQAKTKIWISIYFSIITDTPIFAKDHSFGKQAMQDLQFMKTRSSSPNLSKLARADISCQFMKTRSLCRLKPCTVYKMNGL